jgi:acetyl-CoA carboxylase biotin carboxylase subunit
LAVAGAKAIGYENAGTMEFLATTNNEFYFLEMNTRLQVEHPITEAVTHVDIVKQQIRIAAGEQITECPEFAAQTSKLKEGPFGYAIECRIMAEDEDKDFMPTPGKITDLRLPSGPGVRVDSFIYPGYTIVPYYDSLIAKFITWAMTRNEAIVRMERVLNETVISGIKTTIPFHLRILINSDFRNGNLSTSLIDSIK